MSPHLLYIDGASRGNPGPASVGAVLKDQDGTPLRKISAPIGVATNNMAEYCALISGLAAAISEGVKRLEILSDSELLVRQLTGSYKVKAPGLVPLYNMARLMLDEFDSHRVRHIRREENREADALANQALKGGDSANPEP